MNIAVYFLPLSSKGFDAFQEFIVETFSLLIQQHSEHKFVIISDQRSAERFHSYPNLETIVQKPVPKNGIFKKLWLNIKLRALLKKTKADMFMTFDDACSPATSIPQCLFIHNRVKIKKSNIKKAQLLIVPDKLMKKELIEKYDVPEQKIVVQYLSADKIFEPIDEGKKANIKAKYSDNKEFFLFNSNFSRKEDLINLLKAFSHFKKRQQSNFKILLTISINPFIEKSLADYKYRNDVRFIDISNLQDQALITASAYAAVLPFNTNENMIATLNAMKAGVPVIAVKNSIVNEVADDAALYAETGAVKDMGEKMIQVYTDENYRSNLIEKGKKIAATYTNEKAAGILWQSIMEVFE